MRSSRDRRFSLRMAIKSIRDFEDREGMKPIKRERIRLPDGARSIVSTLADGRRYACGYL